MQEDHIDVMTLAEIFSHVCGQGRCFVIDGSPLPVCQRCFGLYVGAAVTGAWLLLSGAWRRGLPGRGAVVVQAIALATAMLGGLHMIDAGLAWRLSCGLWTGHVVVSWLVGGAVQLSQDAGAGDHPKPPVAADGCDCAAHLPAASLWQTGRDVFVAMAWVAGLTAAAVAFPHVDVVGWSAWAIVMLAGSACLAIAVVMVLAAVVGWVASAVTHREPATPQSGRPD